MEKEHPAEDALSEEDENSKSTADTETLMTHQEWNPKEEITFNEEIETTIKKVALGTAPSTSLIRLTVVVIAVITLGILTSHWTIETV